MKLNIRLSVFFLLFSTYVGTAQPVAISTNGALPHPSAMLDIQSNSKGLLIPRMTTSERNAIATPATGLMIFDNTTGTFWFKSNGNWVELVDSTNNGWGKNNSDVYLRLPGNVGIGTYTPLYSIHIKKAGASLGFFDIDDNINAGSIESDIADLGISAYRKPLFGTGSAGNLILQNPVFPTITGNVGIGTSDPRQKLHVFGSVKSTGQLLIQKSGVDKGSFFATNNDFVMSLSGNNSVGDLVFKTNGQERFKMTNGGYVQFGNGLPGSFVSNLEVTNTGEVNRPLVTGFANMVPICYGRVGQNGNVISGTGNFSVTLLNTGDYKITIPSETSMYSFQNNYSIFLTARGYFAELLPSIESDNTIRVKVVRYKVFYDNFQSQCWEQPIKLLSIITSYNFHEEVNESFNFIVYKN